MATLARLLNKLYLVKAAGVELRLVNDLDGDLLPGGDVLGQLDLGEVALADRLEQAVLADVRLLARAAGRDARRRHAIGALKSKENKCYCDALNVIKACKAFSSNFLLVADTIA